MRSGHRQKQVGTLDLIAGDAMGEMMCRQLISTLTEHLDGTTIDRIAILFVAHATGLDVDLVGKATTLEFSAQNDFGHGRTADIAGTHGHHGIHTVTPRDSSHTS